MPRKTNLSIKEYTLKSGQKRYYFKISLGENSNGKRIVTTRRGFKTYADADQVYNQLTRVKADDFVKQNQITIDELHKIWFENYKNTVKESSAKIEKNVYKNHIKSCFGNQFIDKITVVELQKWADKKATELVAFHRVISIMNALFEYGMRLNYVSSNLVKRVLIPKKTTRKRRDTNKNVYTREELETFLNIAKTRSIMQYTFFKILACTGLRRSECLALTWQDIDFKNNLLSVNKTLARGFNSQLILQTPKSRTSNRKIPISSALRKLLIEYQKHSTSEKLFHTVKNKYLNLSAPNTWLDEIFYIHPELRKITIHGFRHTFATLLISETNVKPKTVQMLLGHKNIEITLNLYTHINQDNKIEAQKVIEQLNF